MPLDIKINLENFELHMGRNCPGVSSEEAGKSESCEGCPNVSSCASPRQADPDIQGIQGKLRVMRTIVAIMSGKGGVGKSTITRNIAEEISTRGIRTCVLDLDFSGPSIPRLTGTDELSMQESNNVIYPVEVNEFLKVVSVGHLQESSDDPTVFSSNLKTGTIKRLLRDCDYGDTEVLLIDTPPNISDEHLGLVNFIKPDFGIVVTTPQKFSLQDVIRQIDFCKKAKIKILGIVENMKRLTCYNCQHQKDIFKDVGVESYCSSSDISYLGSIDLRQDIAKSSDSGMPTRDIVFERLANVILSARD